mgnify:CR=1 FL=1
MEIIIDGVAYKGTSGDDDFTVSTNLQNITIQGYQGADNVELQASLTYTRIWTADDDDLISIDDSLINSTIGAGAGQDVLTVSSTATVDETKFWGGADDDGITIDGSLTNSTLGAGSGSDTLSISSTATVDGSKFWNGPNNDDISVSGSLKNSRH